MACGPLARTNFRHLEPRSSYSKLLGLSSTDPSVPLEILRLATGRAGNGRPVCAQRSPACIKGPIRRNSACAGQGCGMDGQASALVKYWRCRPFMFSFEPGFHGEYGSQK